MRCVIQRVAQASVSVAGEQIGAIQQGFMVLIGVSIDDTDHDVHYMAPSASSRSMAMPAAAAAPALSRRRARKKPMNAMNSLLRRGARRAFTSKPDVSARICRCRSSTTAL